MLKYDIMTHLNEFLMLFLNGPHSGCTAYSVVPEGFRSEYALSPTLLSLS